MFRGFISFLILFQVGMAHAQIEPYYLVGNSLVYLEDFTEVELQKGQTVEDSFNVYILDNSAYLHIWDKSTGREIKTIHSTPGDLSIDKGYLFIRQDRIVHVLDTAGKAIQQMELGEEAVWRENTTCVHDEYFCVYRTDGRIDITPIDPEDQEHRAQTIDSTYTEPDIYNDRIFSSSYGLIAIRKREAHYEVKAYDDNGMFRFKTDIEHTLINTENNMKVYSPYLDLLAYTNDYVYFTDRFHRFHHETHFVGLHFGAVSEFGFRSSAGYMLDDDRKRIEAMFFINRNQNTLEIHTISETIEAEFEQENNSNEVSAFRDGTSFIVADYNRIATGANLRSVNKYSGRVEWKADVVQLNAEHSKYRNKVIVHPYKDKVVMHGMEQAGEYLQVFDVNTGKRLYSSIEDL